MLLRSISLLVWTVTCSVASPDSRESRSADPDSYVFYLNVPRGHKTSEKLHEEISVDHNRHEIEKSHSKRSENSYDSYTRNFPYLRDQEDYNGSRKTFRTYGRGKAEVLRRGDTVYVPNEFGRRRGHKDPVSMRLTEDNEIRVKNNRQRSKCKECPTDQTILATKGSTFAYLPEPCPTSPKSWDHESGPKPGAKVHEGVHLIRGTLKYQKKFCQYHYQVLVNRCEQLSNTDELSIECSAENAWGSVCNVTCTADKEPVGPTTLECREDLTWSDSLPMCKSKSDCLIPKVKTKSKIACETARREKIEDPILPNGSICSYFRNGQKKSLICKKGKWLLAPRKTKEPPKNDPCNPNPCQNGGTCLKSNSNEGAYLCQCRPQTRGIHCEMRECYYNICQNNGLCIYQNEERACYCSPEYNGDTCEHVTVQ